MRETDEHGAARQSDPETSRAAAMAVDPTPLRTLIMKELLMAPDGLTTFEIAQRTGVARDHLSPRIRPMVDRKLVYDTGLRRRAPETGRLQIVWRLQSLLDLEINKLLEED